MAGGQVPIHHCPWAEVTVMLSPEWADSWRKWRRLQASSAVGKVLCHGALEGSVQIGLGLPVLEVENGVVLPTPRVSASPLSMKPPESSMVFFLNESYMKYNCFRNSLLPETFCLTLGTKIKRKQTFWMAIETPSDEGICPKVILCLECCSEENGCHLHWWSSAPEVECHCLLSCSSESPHTEPLCLPGKGSRPPCLCLGKSEAQLG